MKTPRHFFALLLFFSNATPALFAQTATPNQIPDPEQKLAAATVPAEQAELCNELAFATLKKNVDRSLSYADRALEYAWEAGASRESLKALNLQGDALLRKNDTRAAEKAYKDALALLKTMPDAEFKGIAESLTEVREVITIGKKMKSSILSQAPDSSVPEDLDQARFGNIGDKARAALDSMSDIVWAVNPQNDSMQQIVQRMTSFASETLESTGITPHFSIAEEVEQLSLPLEKRKDFYLIFKEAVTNCAKYSRAQHAHIFLKKEDGQLVFELSDDGIGLPTDVKKLPNLGGNGLNNMAARAVTIGAAFSVGNGVEKGTVVLLKIPV